MACGDPVHQARLESFDCSHGDGFVGAVVSLRKQDVGGAFISPRKKTVWLLAGPKVGLLRCLVEGVSKMTVPTCPLPAN